MFWETWDPFLSKTLQPVFVKWYKNNILGAFWPQMGSIFFSKVLILHLLVCLLEIWLKSIEYFSTLRRTHNRQVFSLITQIRYVNDHYTFSIVLHYSVCEKKQFLEQNICCSQNRLTFPRMLIQCYLIKCSSAWYR